VLVLSIEPGLGVLVLRQRLSSTVCPSTGSPDTDSSSAPGDRRARPPEPRCSHADIDVPPSAPARTLFARSPHGTFPRGIVDGSLVQTLKERGHV